MGKDLYKVYTLFKLPIKKQVNQEADRGILQQPTTDYAPPQDSRPPIRKNPVKTIGHDYYGDSPASTRAKEEFSG